MNKEILINPKTGKSKKVWSLDVPGLLKNGWVRQGCEVDTKNEHQITDEPGIDKEPDQEPEPEQDKKPTSNKKAK